MTIHEYYWYYLLLSVGLAEFYRYCLLLSVGLAGMAVRMMGWRVRTSVCRSSLMKSLIWPSLSTLSARVRPSAVWRPIA